MNKECWVQVFLYVDITVFDEELVSLANIFLQKTSKKFTSNLKSTNTKDFDVMRNSISFLDEWKGHPEYGLTHLKLRIGSL